jgi:hypothetical protein
MVFMLVAISASYVIWLGLWRGYLVELNSTRNNVQLSCSSDVTVKDHRSLRAVKNDVINRGRTIGDKPW